jgi:hypothetical protein
VSVQQAQAAQLVRLQALGLGGHVPGDLRPRVQALHLVAVAMGIGPGLVAT